MGWRSLLCCVTLLALAHEAGAGTASPVQVLTSELPPMATAASTDAPGALHEMVSELASRTGVPMTVHFVPWRRAVHLSTTGPRTAIFPIARSPEREQHYRWLAPLHRVHFLFLAAKTSRFNLADPTRSRQRRIGVLRGSVMVGYLKAHGYPHVVEASSEGESLRFLERGIVDAVFGDRDVFHAAIKDRMPDRFGMSKPVRENDVWLGGSLDFSEADAALFHQAMKDMIKDGTHARILRKYALKSDQ